MKKIVIAQDLGMFPDQMKRLRLLGKVTFYNDMANSPEEWLERCKGADIVCSGKFGLKQKIYELSNTFFSLPFVGVDWIDKSLLKKNNITVSNCPGCNKDAVSEWIVGMMIIILRKMRKYINTQVAEKLPDTTLGLTGKKVCILGKGNIGSRVGKICKSFDMDISYFERGDDLIKSVKNADIVIDCLGANLTTTRILDKKFFSSLKRGSYFISPTGGEIYDVSALIDALNNNVFAGAALDAGSIQTGDVNDPFYQKLLSHSKILVTPHIAYRTDVTDRVANDMMIDNIEAWIKGKPINVVK